MIVRVKDFNVEMEIKNTGIELEVRDPQDNFLGDLIVTKTQIIWCKGKTARKNGKMINLENFIKRMESGK
jgi:hypothetical protein